MDIWWFFSGHTDKKVCASNTNALQDAETILGNFLPIDFHLSVLYYNRQLE